MLKIIEQSASRLVLRERRLGMTLFAAIFTLISFAWLVVIVLQGIQQLQFRTLEAPRIVGLIAFLVLGVVLVTGGVYACISLMQGTTLTLDKSSATATLETTRRLKRITWTQSIYAISHLSVDTNDELQVFGVYLVLRSGERWVLGALPKHDQTHLEQIMQTVRAFL